MEACRHIAFCIAIGIQCIAFTFAIGLSSGAHNPRVSPNVTVLGGGIHDFNRAIADIRMLSQLLNASITRSLTTLTNMSQPPQILVFGAGAVGAFYGALLARSSPKSPPSSTPAPQVSCVCRSNYSAVAKSGFALTSPTHGSWTWKPTHVFSSPSAAAAARIEWDYILITTKALPDVSDDSSLITDLVSPRSSIVLIQTGLGVE